MSELFNVFNVKEVQIALGQDPTPKPVLAIPPVEIKLHASYVNKDAIDAMLMGMDKLVEAPKEATFTAHGFTATIAFHDDGTKDFPGTGGCVQMAMTMTGDLVDVAFESQAKNRAWRRLKRRRMLLDCRKRWRTYQVTRDYRQLCRWLDRRTAWYAQAFSAAGEAIAKSEQGRLWRPEHLNDLNTLRVKFGLRPLTEGDL